MKYILICIALNNILRSYSRNNGASSDDGCGENLRICSTGGLSRDNPLKLFKKT